MHFKIAPGLLGFDGVNQGEFQMNQGKFSKNSAMLPKHNKVWTPSQRVRFSVVFILKTSKITPKRKVHSKYMNFCNLLYLCEVSPQAYFDSKLLHLVVDFLLPMGSFTRTNLHRCARYFKACIYSPCVFVMFCFFLLFVHFCFVLVFFSFCTVPI